ncbi:MAG: leucine-rich repeat protein, partial [Lachnospiraceae bacterium]|nr:leucine-rich repeat protein [Lachnospiraceae bacterium]
MKQKQRGRSIRTILCMMVVMLLMACTVVMKKETISSVAAGKSFAYDGKNLSKFKGEKTFVLQKNVSHKEKQAFVKAYRKNAAKFARVTTVEFSGKLTKMDDDMLVFFPNMKKIVLGAKIADVPEEGWTYYYYGVKSKYSQFASFQVNKGNQDYQAKDGVLYNKRMTKLVRIPDQYSKKNLILPDSVTGMVNDAAVPSSSDITTLTIGTSYEGSLKILNTMENLTSINVSGSNTEYASVGGVLYNAAKTKLICWPKANKAESVAFPSTLKSLNVDMLPETTVTLKISKDTTNVYSDNKSVGSHYPLNVLKKLATVTVEDGNTAFKVEQGILYNDKLTNCYGIPAKTKVTEVSLPEGITMIYDGLFTDHDTITKISLPSTATKSNSGNTDIFGGNDTLTSLSEYQVASGNAALKAEDGVLYSADGVDLYCYPIAKKDSSFTVPDTVENIYKNAISSKNTSLTKLVFGKSVEALGRGG